MFARYGRATVQAAIDDLLDYGERMVRQAIRELPNGVYQATDWIDDDGFGNGPFNVQVKVTISDDEILVDYTGSHAQVPGPINTPATGLRSRLRALVRALTAPHIPTNRGKFRPLKLIGPPRPVVTAERPAPTSSYWETGGFCLDLVWIESDIIQAATTNVCPTKVLTDADLPAYSSPMPVSYVLEVPAGWLSANGFGAGTPAENLPPPGAS